ncbi:hypothetical protein GQQ23_18730 [Pantoea agglomerans]|uniref:hypothetical protein n=1 Tax=Enterobacter agglomerans TaxID=549 RepID=UPI0013C58551|nr:hypothetical protein [Pantoea agglomerans]NEG64353.1 hypothetical protein [Pantoea agglomerans]
MVLDIEFTCPATLPAQSALQMAELQEKLDLCAQQLFGPRKKELFSPEFVEGGPNVRNTQDETGGYAELSLNAAVYWPTAIYELAHEIIHLLDPRPGYPKGKGASWFEEGLAVHFSLSALRRIVKPTISAFFLEHLKKNQKYYTAHQLFLELDKDVYSRARQIRQKAGHFSDASAHDFMTVSPRLHEHSALKLAESFYAEKNK